MPSLCEISHICLGAPWHEEVEGRRRRRSRRSRSTVEVEATGAKEDPALKILPLVGHLPPCPKRNAMHRLRRARKKAEAGAFDPAEKQNDGQLDGVELVTFIGFCGGFIGFS